MKESKAYQEILEEGRVQGDAQGEARGRAESLFELVEARFGKREAKSFKSALKSDVDPQQLRAVLKLAARCSEIDELIRAIPN